MEQSSTQDAQPLVGTMTMEEMTKLVQEIREVISHGPRRARTPLPPCPPKLAAELAKSEKQRRHPLALWIASKSIGAYQQEEKKRQTKPRLKQLKLFPRKRTR